MREIGTIRHSATICPSVVLSETLDSVCQAACELFEVEHSGMVIFDRDHKKGEVMAEFPSIGARGLEIPIEGIDSEERLVRLREPLIIQDVKNDLSLGPVRDILTSFDIRSILIVPVIRKGKVLGSFSLDSIGVTRQFSDEQMKVCKVFAAQAAVAIENAQLYEDTKKQKDELERLDWLLERLLDASSAIAREENMATGLQSLAEMVVDLTNNTFCRILLLDESDNFLVVKAAHCVQRSAEHMAWEPGLNQRVAIEDWSGLNDLLTAGDAVLLRLSDEENRSTLLRFSRRLKLDIEVQSLLMVPLKMGDRLVGLLDVGEVRVEREMPNEHNPNTTTGFNGDRRKARPSHFAFTDEREKKDVIAAIGSHTAIPIYRMWRHQIVERRRQLLSSLDQAMRTIRAESDTTKLQQEITRMAAVLFDCPAACLYTYHSHLKILEPVSIYQHPDAPLEDFPATIENFISLVAETSKQAVAESGTLPDSIKKMIGVPLKQTGAVEGVLVVADDTGWKLINDDVELLERLAANSSIALQTARLLGRENRVFSRLAILQKIGDYALGGQVAGDLEKILHVVLTGITAGYSLGFNRAILFLRQGAEGELVGKMGIGQLDEREARQSWDQDHLQGLFEFGEYISRLEKNDLPETSVGSAVKSLRLPVRSGSADVFSQAVLGHEHRIVTGNKLMDLPLNYRKTFAPTTDTALIPLIARSKVIGLLTVDNKFTQSPITHEDLDMLITFAGTAALAIDNARLFHQSEVARKKLGLLYKASNELVSSTDPKQVLQDIVRQTREAAEAAWVRVILIDKMGLGRDLVGEGDAELMHIDQAFRPNGIALKVMKTGKPEKIEDKGDHLDRLNPIFLRDKAAAFLCLPFSLHGEQIGVMWIGFFEPRHIPDFELEALQLYVNQAAIAYDNARRIEELDHVRQAADALAAAPNPASVLDQIVLSAIDVLQAESAALWSYDAVRNIFIKDDSVVKGISAEDWDEFWKSEPRAGGTAHSVMEQRYIGVTDVNDQAQYPFLGASTQSLLDRLRIKSFQGVALTVGDEKLGVLYVNYKRHRGFSEEEKRIAQTLANHAALALKKAKLLEQLSKARDAVRFVAQITTLEHVDRTLGLIVELTLRAIDCDAVTLYTYDGEQDNIGFPPATAGLMDEGGVTKLGYVDRKSVVWNILNRDERVVADSAAEHKLMAGPFVNREGIKSSVGIPLIVGDRKVGVMFVNYRSAHRFTSDELINMELFSYQAAVAIRNGQLYGIQQRHVDTLEILNNAAQAITSSLDLDETLNHIAEQAWRIAARQNQRVSFSHIRLMQGTKARLVAAYPTKEMDKKRAESRLEIDIQGQEGRPKGIIGRAVSTGDSQLVADVKQDPDYISCSDHTRSELVVPIKRGKTVIGIVNIEHPEPAAFNNEDRLVLESLAAQASISIENARHFEELNKSKDQEAAKTAVALIGLASSVWGHSIIGHAMTIEETMDLIVDDLPRSILTDSIAEKISRIKRAAREIKNEPLSPSSTGKKPEAIAVNALIRERLEQKKAHAYRDIQLDWDLNLGSLLMVRAHPEFLQHVLDLLLDNALKATRTSETKQIKVSARESDGWAEIRILDTGSGIPPEVRHNLFKNPIMKSEGEKGVGMGLLIARTMIQAYRGDVEVENTSSDGTTMVIRLPIES